jgi:hypothetical protein
MEFSIIAPNLKTYSRMTHSIITFRKMTFSQDNAARHNDNQLKTLSIMTFSKTTLRKMAFNLSPLT